MLKNSNEINICKKNSLSEVKKTKKYKKTSLFRDVFLYFNTRRQHVLVFSILSKKFDEFKMRWNYF